MKAYYINNEFKFTDSDFFDADKNRIMPICEREFTQDEIEFPALNIGGTDIVVDQAKKSAKETALLPSIAAKRISEIDQKTSKLITDSGYMFKGQLMSSSDNHRAKLESLHNNRASAEMQAVFPFTMANKDNTGFVEILDANDIHAMYVTANLQLKFAKEMAGNAEKLKINNIMNDVTKNQDGSNMTTQDKIAALQNYVDLRV